ncbi:RluA family pseudouridine synthase [Candidatus Laterigemmans baculatus]|uniref:RluA family pseudouridine synthase n=1 Tax=Candidatus Laterigemmans baculatus TaxID=2770505 RepID=UPI0013DB75BF|nr:RNA pseudouridine synthase [Candidatus Laterigemmans baculatus]
MRILWEDSSALVVCKPAGLLTQGAAGIETLETKLRAFLKERDSHPGEPYIGLPHRIDRPVSGAVLVARNIRATRRFGGQFQSRKIGKSYLALVAGEVAFDEGEWVDYLRKIPDRPVAEIVPAEHPEARRAVLRYRVLERRRSLRSNAPGEGSLEDGPVSLLSIELETGRMHQIRLQCSSRGYPILGDATYGSSLPFGPEVEDPRQRAIALHAREIRFRHPKSGVEVRVVAPLGDAWRGLTELE